MEEEEEEHLPPPNKLIYTTWKYDEIREAVEKSRAALLDNLSSISTSTSVTHDLHLINLASVENLFLVKSQFRMAEENA